MRNWIEVKALALTLFVSVIVFAASGDTLTWTGGSTTSDNFSDAANWSSSGSHTTPESGDTLVFRGETRTTPYNDLDPDSYTFAKIVFTNDNSAGLSAPFTLTGNKLKLVGNITGIKTTSGSLTDTFDLEVEFTGKPWLGVASTSSRNYVFNKKVSAPTNQSMENPSQYQGSVYFNGDIEGFDSFYHPNGPINVYFRGVNSAFSHVNGYNFNQGNLYFIDAATFGPAPIVRSGQGGYSTAGSVYFDPTNDVTITAKIGVTSPSQSDNGLTLVNRTAGTTVTFTGDVVESGTKEANGSNAGTKLVVDGSGTGVFKGNFTKDRMAFTKLGAGTWILSDEIETCSMTGLVTVSAGKLVVDCTLQSNQAGEVKSGATIAGKGSLGAPFTFVNGSKYEVSVNVGGSYNTLSIQGKVTLAGNVTVNRVGDSPLAPGSRTCLLRFGSKEGVGAFVVGTGFPSDAVFSLEADALYVDVPAVSLVWNGAQSGTWNTTDANWVGGLLFSDNSDVSFPDLVDAAKRAVDIPSVVTPLSMTVTAAADRPYVFSGNGGVSGVSSIEFSGTATNTWAAPVRNVGSMTVSAGGLVLQGRLENGSLIVGENATLTQSVDSAICGNASFLVSGSRVDLCGTNTFTGGLNVGQRSVTGGGAPTTHVYIRTPNAVGNGDVTVNYNSYLDCLANVAVTNHTFHFWGYNSYSRVNIAANRTFDWAGDIVVHEYPQGELIMGDSGTIRLGNEDGSSTFSTTHGRSVTVVGDTHMFANFYSGSSFSFRKNLWLYSTNNVWSSLGINTGTAHMMAANALPPGKPVTMLQQWNNVEYEANLNLNGFDQTISALNVTDYNRNVRNWARIRSELPATLTISNATDSSFSDTNTFYVLGCVTLRKMGLGTWTLGCNNSSTGNIEIVEGVIALAAAASLPVGAESTLRVTDGATLEIPEGMEAEIPYVERVVGGNTRLTRAGLYGSRDCTVPGAVKVEWLTGAGVLRVKRGKGGVVIVFR